MVRLDSLLGVDQLKGLENNEWKHLCEFHGRNVPRYFEERNRSSLQYSIQFASDGPIGTGNRTKAEMSSIPKLLESPGSIRSIFSADTGRLGTRDIDEDGKGACDSLGDLRLDNDPWRLTGPKLDTM